MSGNLKLTTVTSSLLLILTWSLMPAETVHAKGGGADWPRWLGGTFCQQNWTMKVHISTSISGGSFIKGIAAALGLLAAAANATGSFALAAASEMAFSSGILILYGFSESTNTG